MAGKESVLIGCRIPNGHILIHPRDPKIRVTLQGPKIVMANPNQRNFATSFAVTEVDADFWESWKAIFAKNPIMLSQAIFEAKSLNDANAKGKELAKEKTGFEQMPQNALGVQKEAAEAA